jgi:type II secretory pathway pseudopilin PulG
MMTRHAKKSKGFSLVEVLLLVVVLGIVGAAAGRALQVIAKVPDQTDQNFQLETRLISKMEQVRSLGFDAVTVGNPNTTLSDTVTVSGKNYPRIVVVALADGDGNAAADATLKQITVTCAGRSVSTLISK